jgi:MFS family permease
MGFQSETSCGVGLDAADSSSQDADPDGLLSFDIIQSQQKKQLNNNNIKKINENKVSSSSSSSSPSSGSENEEEEENESEAEDDETTELKAGDGGNAKQRVSSSSSSSSTSFESTLGDNDKMPKSPPPRSSTKVKSFDEEIEELTEKSLEFISNGSFFGCGFYQFISFLFISIAWSVANGWYSYCSVFTGYTPEHTCDTKAMMLLLNESTSTSTPVSVMSDFVSSSVSSTEFDEKCFYRDSSTNSTGKCTKWIYDKSQMESTLITEFDFVCEKNYYFETAYSIEQIGYLIGTLGFSFLADKVGRKPVLCASLISMSIFGLVQTFTSNFYLFYMLGALINTLACGLDAVCVTMVLEMFTTNKRTLFGIGIEVIWVIVLALLSPLAYAIKKWRELRLVIFIILTIMSALSYWLVQESIRWLISDSRYTRAIKVIKRIAKFNKLDSHVDENEFNKTKYTLKIALAGLEKLNKPPLPPPSSRPSSSDAADESQPQFPLRRDNDTVANVFKNTKFRRYR